MDVGGEGELEISEIPTGAETEAGEIVFWTTSSFGLKSESGGDVSGGFGPILIPATPSMPGTEIAAIVVAVRAIASEIPCTMRVGDTLRAPGALPVGADSDGAADTPELGAEPEGGLANGALPAGADSDGAADDPGLGAAPEGEEVNGAPGVAPAGADSEGPAGAPGLGAVPEGEGLTNGVPGAPPVGADSDGPEELGAEGVWEDWDP